MRHRFIDPCRVVGECLNELSYKETATGEIKATDTSKIALALMMPLSKGLWEWFIERQRQTMLAASSMSLADTQQYLDTWYGVGNVLVSEGGNYSYMYEPINNDGVSDPVPPQYCWGDNITPGAPYGQLGLLPVSEVIVRYNKSIVGREFDQLLGDLRILMPFWVKYTISSFSPTTQIT